MKDLSELQQALIVTEKRRNYRIRSQTKYLWLEPVVYWFEKLERRKIMSFWGVKAHGRLFIKIVKNDAPSFFHDFTVHLFFGCLSLCPWLCVSVVENFSGFFFAM